MGEWGLNPSTFQAVGSIATAIGLVIAFLGIYRTDLHNRRSRNLQADLRISEDLRGRWERGWGKILREDIPKMDLDERHRGEVGRELTYMLIWLEHVGQALKHKWIDREVLFGSRWRVIQDMIKASSYRIQQDEQEPDPYNPHPHKRWWPYVWYLAQQPEINLDIAREAQALIDRWGCPKNPPEKGLDAILDPNAAPQPVLPLEPAD